jgi:hypothetical protein
MPEKSSMNRNWEESMCRFEENNQAAQKVVQHFDLSANHKQLQWTSDQFHVEKHQTGDFGPFQQSGKRPK